MNETGYSGEMKTSCVSAGIANTDIVLEVSQGALKSRFTFAPTG